MRGVFYDQYTEFETDTKQGRSETTWGSWGVASGVVRREKRKMRQVLSDLLNNPTADGKDLKEIVAFGLIKKAASGDIKAFETLVKFIGEMPTEREFTETDEEIKVNPWGLK